MAPQEKGTCFPINRATQAGMKLAHPPPGDEIVISGISGTFPESKNVYHFKDNLFNKVDMVTGDCRRWKKCHPAIPQRTGKIPILSKFDASFFGIHYKQALAMDPMCHIILEKTYEAIVDAGINPHHLRGKNVGVFIGSVFSESELTWFYEKLDMKGVAITGHCKSMFASRISYWLGINGPNHTLDSACSSTLYALDLAYRAIREGLCDSAIVGGAHLCLHPFVSLQFARLGVLSPDGRSKTFDRDANGYARSESICVIYLQKARDAKRVYSSVIHSKTNCDGFKENGITYPSAKLQEILLKDFYQECAINPTSVGYVEAHGTGTKVGDPEELHAIDEIFCKGRNAPLPIGSVKSNMGHSEPVSGLASVTKVIIAMETGFIGPNLHYNNPREGVEGLEKGRLKVVTDKYPLPGGLVGINSFGFGGANAHVLLKWNEKVKVNGSAPADPLPRLVTASGRTEEAVDVILKDFEGRPVDAEYVYMMQELQSDQIPGHFYRGYTLLTNDSRKIRNIQYYPGFKRPVWFVFTGMGSQWSGMGKSLLKIPVFAAAIDRCQRALKPHGVDLINIITSEDPSIFDNIINCFVGIVAYQIGLTDIMKTVGIKPDGIVGHSIGELCCGYADGCLTAEQVVQVAYYQARALFEAKSVKGEMANIGLAAEKVRALCSSDVEVICHNGPNSCTVSGPQGSMKKFLETLQQKGISTEKVNCANTIYHSKHVSNIGAVLLENLKKVIPNPKCRSSRWLSSSVSGSAVARYCSAEYHTNSLLCAVQFEETIRLIPMNAITIEFSPRGFLQNVLDKSFCKTVTSVTLTQYRHQDGVCMILTSLGRLFELGLQPQLTQLYPPIQYPVSRGTPMIAPLIRWEHSHDWFVPTFSVEENKKGSKLVRISLQDEEQEYISGHVVDGRNLFPATGYIVLIWEYLAAGAGKLYPDVSIVFENVRFHRATTMPKEGAVQFSITVQKGSGKFEIMEGGALVVSGTVCLPEDISQEMLDLESCEEDARTKGTGRDDLIDFSSRDIYKELHLRGYNYHGLFRGLISTDGQGQRGSIQWCDNWVAFMDNMLQMKILQTDTRSIFVPTSVEKLSIDVTKHGAVLQTSQVAAGKSEIPVYASSELNMVWSGGVQIEGLKASAIARRKPLGDPVLEKYIFVANVEPEQLDVKTALRVCTHIALENQFGIQVRTAELYKKGSTPLSPELVHILGDLPLIQADITILANPEDPSLSDLELVGYKIEDQELSEQENCMLIIASDLLQDSKLLRDAMNALATGACILSREKLSVDKKVGSAPGIDIVFQKTLEDETLVLLKKGSAVEDPVVIEVSASNYDWLEQIQCAIENSSKHRILVVAQGDELNGILGLVNCIRKEPGGDKVRCVFIPDKTAPRFDPNLEFYREQLNKDLAVNIYKNGKWGTYRHLPLESNALVTVPHAYCNVLSRGDLSSLRWLEGNIDPKRNLKNASEELVYIYYSALNFRDIMTATGKISVESVAVGRLNKDCVQGLEFSGRDRKGRRVMGMLLSKAMATLTIADVNLLWDVPDHWTLEEAATVPIVYGTVYYALTLSGRMKNGDSVLIHAGSGGVGQAAINVCLHAGCTVYTTVGTPEKREFIKKQFPQLTDENIGNSRDTSFEDLIMLQTKGRGVDIVLNSLSEDKLQASLRCLAIGGRFLEIGKFDLENNSPIGMELFLKETSFHGIMLDRVFQADEETKKVLHRLLSEGIKSGAVRPLTRTVYEYGEVEQAFRYLAAGKHIGKVLLKIRPEENDKVVTPVPWPIEAIPRYFCLPDCTYIIAGGLGGLGLELADWLVLRGARKLVLTSRTGLRNGYQSSRVRLWQSYGVKVLVSLADISTAAGVKGLLTEAVKLGPVDAIFNLAVVLKDALLNNQTVDNFIASAGPKPVATHHLDVLSREMCPALRHFVVFSSVSCGRGNAGQTNYGMNNSIMERICEARVRDGFPGLAVQWGAVGDVGLVADMQEENTEIVIGGTLPQKIFSCLDELDKFMKQSHPVVVSMVVAEKRAGRASSGSIIDSLCNILGIGDLKSVSQHSALAELGMDSMMAVEIKQVLEREFEIFLTAQEIRRLTFANIKELSKKDTNLSLNPQTGESHLEGLQLLLHMIGGEESASESVLHLPSAYLSDRDESGPVLIMMPGVEGTASVLKSLASNLRYQTLCLQYGYLNIGDSIQEMAFSLIPRIEKNIPPGASFVLLGYSFGGLLALEIVHHLEQKGWEGQVYLVDSAPDYLKNLYIASLGTSEEEFDVKLLTAIWDVIARQSVDLEIREKMVKDLTPLKTYEEKLDYFLTMVPPTDYSVEHLRAIGMTTRVRIKALGEYEWSHRDTLKSKTVLLKPSTNVREEDYGLSKICEKKVDVHSVAGNHVTILDNEETANIINSYLSAK